MKKLLPFVIICLLGFYACKKSDSDNKSTDANTLAIKIIGKWTSVKYVSIKTVNGADSVTNVDSVSDPNDYTEFYKDGTGYSPSNSLGYENFTYKIIGDSLYRSVASYTATDKIKTLTSNSLVLRYTERSTVDANFKPVVYSTEVYYSK